MAWKLGLRFSGEAAYASLSAYYNRYDDFIESMRFIGVNDEGLTVYQSQNIAEARIYGLELKAGLELGALSETLQGWSLRGAAAWSRARAGGRKRSKSRRTCSKSRTSPATWIASIR